MATIAGYHIVSHPPKRQSLMSRVPFDEQRPVEEFLTRNRMIVDEVDLVIACPQTAHEVLRSGTWSTIRYCQNRHPHKVLVIVRPEEITIGT